MGSNPTASIIFIMIQKESKLRCADNSGANILKCIRVGVGKKKAILGSTILVVIKNFKKRNKKLKKKVQLKKKNKYLGLIVNSKNRVRRHDGTFFCCDKNKVLLINLQNQLIGTRVYGCLVKELNLVKNKKYQKLVSVAKFLI